VHKIERQCEYEAISYAWGDFPYLVKELYLGNQVVKISENLYAALMAYSYPGHTRVLWADAICINQEDTTEKSQQVAIMADIYRKAKTVQVWLSLASDLATDAMKFMANLSSKAESFGISDEVDHPRAIQGWPSLNISLDKAEKLIHDAIEEHVDFLLSRSWFNRVWVVQEVNFATKLVVSCGHSTIDWTSLARALEVLCGAYREVRGGEERLRMGGVMPAWELVQHRDAFRLLSSLYNLDHHMMTNLAASQMSTKACSDDRDRVYAMMAMTKSPHSMTVDYSKTVAETYTEFTRKYSPNKQIYWAGLSQRKCHSNPEEVDTHTNIDQQPLVDIADRNYLPSWVPEFRPALIVKWWSPHTETYSTALKAPLYFVSPLAMPKVMVARGIIFDVIVPASLEYDAKWAPRCAFAPSFYFSVIDTLRHMSCAPHSGLKPYSEPSCLILAKTLTGGTSECNWASSFILRCLPFRGLSHLQCGSFLWLSTIWARFNADCLAPTGEIFQHMLLKALGAKSKPLSNDTEVAVGFLGYLAIFLTNNRLFVTSKGYMGFGPRDIRSGDRIAIFNGCHMPYVVRPAGKVKCKGKMKYKGKVDVKEKMKNKKEKLKRKEEPLKRALQVIGPCYLQGIMEGEIFTNRDAPQFSGLKWTRHDGDLDDSLEGFLLLV
jgi:hypothetical protein